MSPDKDKCSTSSGQEQQVPDFDGDRSQIVEFYKGRSVLVTGASGFLGKLIIEKLLRTCKEIKKVFVLVRPKKNKSARERIDELLNSALFDRLRSDCNSEHNAQRSFQRIRSKLVVLEGELERQQLGLDEKRLLELAGEVSVIIHSAAIVSFIGKLRLSTDTNLAGTHNVLQLASKLPKLCAVVHVSTCYSNCNRESTIGDHLYPVDIEPLQLLKIVESLDDESVEVVRNQVIGKHPNNYTLTKQLAEYLCGQFTIGPQKLPVLVCRPSIIVTTHKEPVKGFVDNHKAANGLLTGVSRGFVRCVPGRGDTIVDLVPADLVSNCIIALGWFADLYHRVRLRIEMPMKSNADSRVHSSNSKLEQKMIEYYHQRKNATLASAIKVGLDKKFAQVPVVNISSRAEQPVTLQRMLNLVAKHSTKYPSLELFRKPKCVVIRDRRVYALSRFIQHTLVGKLMEYVYCSPRHELVPGSQTRRPVTWSRQFLRCDILAHVLTYFCTNDFQFDSGSRRKLIDDFMNDEDRRLFNCDFRCIDYETYTRDMVLGMRRYLIGDSDETLPEARQKYQRTLWRNSLIKFMSIALIFFFAYTLFS